MKFQQFGKYTILKKLAGGGMAEIFLACDLGPAGVGRFLAIKKALSHFSKNEEFIDMFKNEGKVACNLKHGNIAPIYEFGFEDNQLYLSMEYISGRNLRELAKKIISLKTPLDIPYSVYIIKEVAAGLNYAHNAVDSSIGQPLHLIHRDISPQNIMISFDGDVKIIDFGIAKIADTDLTKAGHLKGKFGYMSPEQARGEKLDMRGDIFCLGIILWELLANKRLFKCDNEMATLRRVQACDIPNLQNINPQVSSSLEKIVIKALKKNKNSRYKTALEFERDLNRFLTKAYPEFDRYDFSAFIKKIYAKDILSERETLKKYSKQFKEYMKLYCEQDLSHKTNITQFGEEKGFSNPDFSSASVASALSNATLTMTAAEDEVTDHAKKSVTREKNTATKKYENSLLTESMAETKGSLSLTAPRTSKVIFKGEDSQLSQLLKDQKSKSYSLSPFSTDQTELEQEDVFDFLSLKKKLIFPLVSIVLLISISGGIYWVLKNLKTWTKSSQQKAFTQSSVPTTTFTDSKKTSPTVPKKTSFNKQPSKTRVPAQENAARRTVASQKTTIYVRTIPSGASVYIKEANQNKKFAIRTPNFLRIEQQNGPIEIHIAKKGYHSKIIKAQSIRKLSQKIDVRLERKNTSSY